MQKEIVAALMGAGRAGREHAANLCSVPDVRVGFICDPMLDLARAAGKLARAEKVTDSVDEVFERKDIEAVIISTPAGSHALAPSRYSYSEWRIIGANLHQTTPRCPPHA